MTSKPEEFCSSRKWQQKRIRKTPSVVSPDVDQRDHATALLPVVRRRWSKDPRQKKTERREATEPPTECGAGGNEYIGVLDDIKA